MGKWGDAGSEDEKNILEGDIGQLVSWDKNWTKVQGIILNLFNLFRSSTFLRDLRIVRKEVITYLQNITKTYKIKCFRRKYLKASKSRGCGNIRQPNFKKCNYAGDTILTSMT